MTETLRELAVPRLWPVLSGSEVVGRVAVTRNQDGVLDLNWFVEEQHRGQGLCTATVLVAVEQLRSAYPGERVVALIRPWNAASLAVARKAGMRVLSEDEDNTEMVID